MFDIMLYNYITQDVNTTTIVPYSGNSHFLFQEAIHVSLLQYFLTSNTMGHFTFACLVTRPMNASKARGDLALTQTSPRKNNLIYTTKAVRSLSKQSNL